MIDLLFMKVIILSVTSDISRELIISFKKKGYEIFGTYNSTEPDFTLLDRENLLKLNINEYNSEKYKNWLQSVGTWDLFISSVGTQKPVGFFEKVNAMEWVDGVSNNSIYQIGALINALPLRNKLTTSTALFFAGGGTNSATPAYSAQNIGKIALIKAVEMLDNEIPNLKVSILGPGWVNTKIHNATLAAKEEAADNFQKTKFMLEKPSLMNPVNKVVDDINTLIALPKSLVGGRNFSSVHDELTQENLSRLKKIDFSFYKLRRCLNDV